MSARHLTLPRYRHLSASLLPFLYQTGTILSSPKFLVEPRRSFHITPRRPKDAIPFENETGNQALDRSAAQHNVLFEAIDDGDDHQSSRPQRASTITASEKAVFDRIFQEISADASKKAAKEEDPLDDELDNELPAKGDAYGDLNAIFDDALKKLRQDSQKTIDAQPQGTRLDGLPKSYTTAVGRDIVFKHLDLAKLRPGQDHEVIQQAVEAHKRKVLAMLDGASSDIGIWQVLETEVFTLIKQHDALEHEAKRREKAEKPKRKRGNLSKADQQAATAAEQKRNLRAVQKTTQKAETDAILSTNYGDYCLAAMRRLRREYPTSPYCMNLLPSIKRLGPISHVLAASVELYNEMLFLLWKEYSDLHGMADVIIEMGNQGLESSEITLRILKMVRNAKLFAFAEDKPMKKWWTLYPVEEGYKRLKVLARNMNREIMQARVRRSVERMESQSSVDGEGGLGPEENGQAQT